MREKRQGPVRPLNSAASIVASPLHGDLLVSADLTADEIMPATSKVATLHRRDCSLSVELSTNEISATGGHLCFVHRRSSAVRPAPGSIFHNSALSRRCRRKRGRLRSVPHWAFSRLHPPQAAAGYGPLDPSGRWLETRRTDKLRLQLERRQASFRAKESQADRPENE